VTIREFKMAIICKKLDWILQLKKRFPIIPGNKAKGFFEIKKLYSSLNFFH